MADELRYEVTFLTGPPGHADSDTYQFATLKEARKCLRNSRENHDPYFRWSKIVDLTTGEQVSV
jgi:hypothetical protein